MPPAATLLRYLILAYALALPLRRVLYLPVVQSKLQAPELIFLALGPVALYVGGRALWPRQGWFPGALLAFVLVGIVAGWRSGATGSVLEAVGRGYLLGLLLVVAYYVRQWGLGALADILRWWSYGCAVMAATGYVGYGLGLAGYVTDYVVLYPDYPYFGTVLRAASTAGSPMATVMVALLPFTWQYRRWRTGRGGGWFLLLLGPLFLLTLAKEVLLVGLGCWLVDPLVRRAGPGLRYGVVVLGVAAYWFSTSYLVERTHDYTAAELVGVVYTGGRVAARLGDYQLTETSYTELKRAALEVGRHYPWLGVGPDRLADHLAEVRPRHYAANLPVYRSHSTWFGALAETGHVGLLLLVVVAVSLGRTVRRARRRWPRCEAVLCLAAWWLLLAGFSPHEELLALRFVYVAAGMALGAAGLPSRA